jgi:predicted TIM-barrel fold metal-dependent hydrolase
VADVEQALSEGASGIGELNADAQGFAWEDRHVMSPVAEYCIERGAPALMHCSEPVGHAYPGKGTATPDRILQFLQSFPSLSVVAAHWGGGLPFYELMPEVALATRNVVYDSAATTYLYDYSVFAHAGRLVGEERIVFGTDYPLLRQKAFLQRVKDSGISPEALPRVLGGTAARVFGLAQEALSR